MLKFQAAPWSTGLKAASLLGLAVLVGLGFAIHHAIPHGTQIPYAESFGTALVAVPLLIFVFAILFVVTGYRLDAKCLYVQRLLWSTRVDLAGLQHAWHDPSAMRRSIRLIGNGGLFSITGVFTNATLGRYRAFVTDPKQAVVLEYPARVVVISPANPSTFLRRLKLAHPGITVEEGAR